MKSLGILLLLVVYVGASWPWGHKMGKHPLTCDDYPADLSRTCIQYYDQCQIDADCPPLKICCLRYPGCGKSCEDKFVRKM